jgi:hypothetical protein
LTRRVKGAGRELAKKFLEPLHTVFRG